ncbi:uncharacterized protein Dana_GF26726 [Drosophila ananassae]|uniref:Uncharacterized protein n=1 Tax=Drosophila ananassae TaxID=7217 RepID=A0A0N8P266_DROAN|nr:uncharacterized protein Dana_GF26726 [Drosophila ananassae]
MELGRSRWAEPGQRRRTTGEPGTTSSKKEEEEEPGPAEGGRYPGTGKGQEERRARGACRAGPPGGAVGPGRANKEDDGATGVAKPEVAAGEVTHPAPTGAEGEGGRGGAMDARSMGVASPEGEAGAGEASLLPGEEASETGAQKSRIGRRWRSSARAQLAARAEKEGGGRGPEEERKVGWSVVWQIGPESFRVRGGQNGIRVTRKL